MPSSIEWTDDTWNPVTGCTRVSPGCDHCYMFALYPRLRGMGVPGYETSPDDVRLLPERLQAPLSWKKPRRVFVNSMADVFHPKVPCDFILQMFLVMAEAADKRGHVFQVLTKRPGRAVAWWEEYQQFFPDGWPPRIWVGTSVESQKYAPRHGGAMDKRRQVRPELDEVVLPQVRGQSGQERPRKLAPAQSASASRRVLCPLLSPSAHRRPPLAPPKAPADRTPTSRLPEFEPGASRL